MPDKHMEARGNNVAGHIKKEKEKKKRGEKVFKEWSDALARNGHNRTWWQVKNKFRAMTKAYNKTREQNNKTGSN